MKHKKQVSNPETKINNEQSTDNISVDKTPTPDNTEASNSISETDYQIKVNELNDKYLRLYSEFDNFRKRTLREKIELSRTASEDLIKDLLPILDDFDRAAKSYENTDDLKSIIEGVILIHAKLKNTLSSKGLKEINAVGENFDTDYHEAITSIPAPSEEMKNKVIEETQKGYILNDKVIRYSKVVTGN